jgi:hypothetical protein
MTAGGAFTVKGKRRANPVAVTRRFRDVVRRWGTGHRRGGVTMRHNHRCRRRGGFDRFGRRCFDTGASPPGGFNDRRLGLRRNFLRHNRFSSTTASASASGSAQPAALVSARRFCGDNVLRGDLRLRLRGFSDGRFGYDRFGGNRRCLGNRRGDHFSDGGFSDSNRRDSFSQGGLNLLFFLLLVLRTNDRVADPHFTGRHFRRCAGYGQRHRRLGRVTLVTVATTTLAADAQMTRERRERRGIPLASRIRRCRHVPPFSTTAGRSTFASSVRGRGFRLDAAARHPEQPVQRRQIQCALSVPAGAVYDAASSARALPARFLYNRLFARCALASCCA